MALVRWAATEARADDASVQGYWFALQSVWLALLLLPSFPVACLIGNKKGFTHRLHYAVTCDFVMRLISDSNPWSDAELVKYAH
jgi:hypothetical protein